MTFVEKVQALARRLHITRPLVWFDYETTSKYPALARVWSIGLVKVWPEDTQPPRAWESYINPGVPIPAEVIELCKLDSGQLADIAAAHSFASVAASLFKGFGDCNFAGYNARYDLKVSVAEFKRCGLTFDYRHAEVLDGFRLWQTLPGEQRSLTDAVRLFAGRNLEGAHGAMADTEGALDAVIGMLDAAGAHVPNAWPELMAHLHPPDPSRIDREGKLVLHDGEAYVMFGKYEGTRLRDIDQGFCRWVQRQDFSAEVKAHFANAIRGIYPCEERSLSEPTSPSAGSSHSLSLSVGSSEF